jgi:hypothetical protein
MSDMVYAFKVMNSILMEAELKDGFSTMGSDGAIRIVLKNGSEKSFQILSNVAGRIIMVDKKSKIEYTFTKDAINDGVFTLFKYDSKSPSFEGEELNIELEEFTVGKKTGAIEEIDLFDPETKERMDQMNDALKSVNKGDIINISSEEIRKNDSITNTILLRVDEKEPNILTCTLEDIDSDSSVRMDKLAKVFRNRNIYIKYNSLVHINGTDLELILSTKETPFTLTGLLDIEVSKSEQNLDDYDEREIVKQEIKDKMAHSKEYEEAIDKTPNFWETLMNATPKGATHINKILKQKVADSGYLTRGNNVSFKLLSDSVIVNSTNKLIKKNKVYGGTIEKNNVIKYGTRRQGHWELKIVKELEQSTYKVKMYFCNKDLTCKFQRKGTIKIINNE